MSLKKIKMIPVSKPSVGKEELALINEVFKSEWLGMGSFVTRFEERIRSFIGAENVIAVNSGTSALFLSLEAAGISAGDEVIVPSLTFCATIQAITALKAKPVFCEVKPDSLCIDPDDIKKRITPATKVIMPVHFCGIPAQMNDILEIGKNKNILIIEDAAHAFGSSFQGAKIGSFGQICCFSFDPIKNITCGEGGVILTNSETLANLLRQKRMLGINYDSWHRRKHNINRKFEVITQGYRLHLSNINAAIGLAQLDKIDSFRSAKARIVKKYNEAFSDIAGISLLKWNLEETFPFSYVMRIIDNQRDDLMAFLKMKGIETSINYIPNHQHPFFNSEQKLPLTEQLYKQIITLPLFTDMEDDEIQYVISCIRSFFGMVPGV